MGDSSDPFMRNQNAAVQARTKSQNRSNVLQLKLMGQSHPTGLTNNLLKLFEPRPPLEFKPPPEKRKCPPYTGMAQFVGNFAEPGDPEYAPPKPVVETPAQKRERIQKSRLEKGAEKVAEDFKKYDPNNDPNASGDPYKTLFVSRLNYESTESKIKREFESYGPIKRVQLVTDKLTNKPRGYAFIEYMHTRDMKAAYKQADGQKIDGRRVLVDVERGRTVPNWRPRRLGGGLGTSRVSVVAGEETVGEQQQPQQQQQGRSSRSEEPTKPREEREKSREKVKERERERSRELSIEQPRERSHDRPREDRESRRDRGGRDRDRERDGRRDRDRGDRDRRDRDRGRDRTTRDHDRDRERRRERDYEGGGEYEQEGDGGGGRSREREPEYERRRSKHHDRDRHGEPEDGRSGYYEDEQGGTDRYSHRYDKMEEEQEEYRYDRDEYKRSERSESREYAR
ncbi:unnamed protein product [Cochlearia groenlandica]